MKQFVPIPDDFPLETLFWPGALVPYRCGLACHRAMDAAARVREPGVTPEAPPPPDGASAWSDEPRWRKTA